MNLDQDKELILDFVTESTEGLNQVVTLLVKLEDDTADRSLLDHIFRVLHSLKGNSGFFALHAVEKIAHRMESLLDQMRQGKRAVTKVDVSLLIQGCDLLSASLKRLAAFLDGDQSNPINLQDFNSQEKEFFEILEKSVNDPQAAVPLVIQKAVSAPVAPDESELKKTIRIDETIVDGFMSYVSELIVASEAFTHLQRRVSLRIRDGVLNKEFRDAVQLFSKLSVKLQKSLLEVRKKPLSSITDRFPRLVRDLKSKLGKELTLEVTGADELVDKSLIEALEDPLVHMLRNSVDHGIEMPEDRVKAGKQESGKITITGALTKTTLQLTVEDDGKGIDPNQMRKVAVKKGFLNEAQAKSLTDAQAIELIFEAGISSKEAISEVSGRGVGMDVVRTQIKAVNGEIELSSVVGKGTRFHITLPLASTSVVAPGLVCEIEPGRLIVIPIESVLEVGCFSNEKLTSLFNSQSVYRVRDGVYPFVVLKDVLFPEKETNIKTKHVVGIKKGDGVLVINVDRLHGIQQVVEKKLDRDLIHTNVISGGVILGDGRVALMLDVEGLIRYEYQTLSKNRKNTEKAVS